MSLSGGVCASSLVLTLLLLVLRLRYCLTSLPVQQPDAHKNFETFASAEYLIAVGRILIVLGRSLSLPLRSVTLAAYSALNTCDVTKVTHLGII